MSLAKLVTPLAALSVAAGILLVAVRTYFAVSFDVPLQVYTSGAEHESLFAIWKQIRGLDVYVDPHRIPFAASYYNWLYFWLYGGLTSVALGVFGLGDPWLPTVTRVLMLLSVCCGAVLLYSFLAGLSRQRATAALVATFVFFGPLAGFWVITTNVELWALIATIAAMYAFCALYPRRPYAAVLAFCLFAYASWAFKQTFVYAIVAVGIYLLWRRDFARLATAVVLLAAGFTITFAAGSREFAASVLQLGTSISFSWSQLYVNLANVATKTLPFTLPFGVIAWRALSRREARERLAAAPYFGLFLLGAAVSAVLIVPASAKIGAAENYYFGPVFFLATALIIGLDALDDGGVASAFALGWLGNLAAVGLVLGGMAGVLSVRDWHPRLTALRACIADLPKPVFSSAIYGNLPWMNPPAQHFVLAYNYWMDRAAGIPFERDGVGGLITEGYFAALLLPAGTENTFDRGSLSRYTRLRTCADNDVWLRQPG